MFHLLTVFPNNAAEQEQYYITKVLKKPQHISIRQFVQHVEQLNSYISQLQCRYYSTSVKASTIPMNVALPFLRLIYPVTFFGCAHIRGRISSTFTRKD
jgi:hypothetical protein